MGTVVGWNKEDVKYMVGAVLEYHLIDYDFSSLCEGYKDYMDQFIAKSLSKLSNTLKTQFILTSSKYQLYVRHKKPRCQESIDSLILKSDMPDRIKEDYILYRKSYFGINLEM